MKLTKLTNLRKLINYKTIASTTTLVAGGASIATSSIHAQAEQTKYMFNDIMFNSKNEIYDYVNNQVIIDEVGEGFNTTWTYDNIIFATHSELHSYLFGKFNVQSKNVYEYRNNFTVGNNFELDKTSLAFNDNDVQMIYRTKNGQYSRSLDEATSSYTEKYKEYFFNDHWYNNYNHAMSDVATAQFRDLDMKFYEYAGKARTENELYELTKAASTSYKVNGSYVSSHNDIALNDVQRSYVSSKPQTKGMHYINTSDVQYTGPRLTQTNESLDYLNRTMNWRVLSSVQQESTADKLASGNLIGGLFSLFKKDDESNDVCNMDYNNIRDVIQEHNDAYNDHIAALDTWHKNRDSIVRKPKYDSKHKSCVDLILNNPGEAFVKIFSGGKNMSLSHLEGLKIDSEEKINKTIEGNNTEYKLVKIFEKLLERDGFKNWLTFLNNNKENNLNSWIYFDDNVINTNIKYGLINESNRLVHKLDNINMPLLDKVIIYSKIMHENAKRKQLSGVDIILYESSLKELIGHHLHIIYDGYEQEELVEANLEFNIDEIFDMQVINDTTKISEHKINKFEDALKKNVKRLFVISKPYNEFCEKLYKIGEGLTGLDEEKKKEIMKASIEERHMKKIKIFKTALNTLSAVQGAVSLVASIWSAFETKYNYNTIFATLPTGESIQLEAKLNTDYSSHTQIVSEMLKVAKFSITTLDEGTETEMYQLDYNDVKIKFDTEAKAINYLKLLIFDQIRHSIETEIKMEFIINDIKKIYEFINTSTNELNQEKLKDLIVDDSVETRYYYDNFGGYYATRKEAETKYLENIEKLGNDVLGVTLKERNILTALVGGFRKTVYFENDEEAQVTNDFNKFISDMVESKLVNKNDLITNTSYDLINELNFNKKEITQITDQFGNIRYFENIIRAYNYMTTNSTYKKLVNKYIVNNYTLLDNLFASEQDMLVWVEQSIQEVN